jgi:hypothetical protein
MARDTALLIAMNGVCRGTSITGNPASSAAAMSVVGT